MSTHLNNLLVDNELSLLLKYVRAKYYNQQMPEIELFNRAYCLYLNGYTASYDSDNFIVRLYAPSVILKG